MVFARSLIHMNALKAQEDFTRYLHSKMIDWDIFRIDNPDRIPLFGKRVPGLDRTRNHGVCEGYVEIGCLSIGEHNGVTSGTLNLNIFHANPAWLDEVEPILHNYFDFHFTGDYIFFRYGQEEWKGGRHTRYEFYSVHPDPVVDYFREKFWNYYHKYI